MPWSGEERPSAPSSYSGDDLEPSANWHAFPWAFPKPMMGDGPTLAGRKHIGDKFVVLRSFSKGKGEFPSNGLMRVFLLFPSKKRTYEKHRSLVPCLHTVFLGDIALWKQKERGMEKHKLVPTLATEVACHFPLYFVNQVQCLL